MGEEFRLSRVVPLGREDLCQIFSFFSYRGREGGSFGGVLRRGHFEAVFVLIFL